MASTLKSDPGGFLVGEALLRGTDDLLRLQRREIDLLRGVQHDVRAIARSIGAQVREAVRNTRTGPGGVRVQAQPVAAARPARTAGGNVIAPAQQRTTVTPPGRKTVVSAAASAAASASAANRQRNARGQFIGKGSATPAGRSKPSPSPAPGDDGVSPRRAKGHGATRGAGAAVHGAAGVAHGVDPTIEAAREVASIVSPVGRGLGGLFRSEKAEKERWYTKFWKTLRRVEENTRDTNHELEKGHGGGSLFGFGGNGGEGGGSFLGSLLGTLFGRKGKGAAGGGFFSRIFGRGGAAVEAEAGAAAKGAGRLGKLGRFGKLLGKGGGLLKRIPLLGTLLTGAGIASAMFSDDDPSKSKEQNRADRYTNVGKATGMGAGAMAGGEIGAAIGTAILPGIGTIIGGAAGTWLGSLVGEKVGGALAPWVKDLVDADIPGKIVNVAKSAWDSFIKDAKDLWKDTKGLGNKVNDVVKNATGVDVKKTLSNAWDATKDTASKGWNAAKDSAAAAVNAGVEVVKKAAPVVAEAAKTAASAAVPDTVKNIAKQAGGIVKAGSNAATLLRAGMDAGMGPKELANFMGQNAHESNNFTTLSEGLNYKSADRIKAVYGKNAAIRGMSDAQIQGLVNNPEALANAVYGSRIGNTEAGDGYKFRGRGFIQLTGKSQYAAAGKALGLDLVNHPELAADPANAAKISAWYWKNSVASKGAGEDVTAATKRINGAYNGLDDRKKRVAEWQAKIDGGTAAMPSASTVTSAMPPVAQSGISAAAPDKVPPAPDAGIPERLNNSAQKPAVAIVMRDTTGQEVSDRGVAHVCSGGIGAGWV